jgi:hypothetical protein
MKKLFTLFAAFAVTFSVAAQRSEPEGAAQKAAAGGEQLVEENNEEKCKQRKQENEEKCQPLEQENEKKRRQLGQEIEKWREQQMCEWRKQMENRMLLESERFAEIAKQLPFQPGEICAAQEEWRRQVDEWSKQQLEKWRMQGGNPFGGDLLAEALMPDKQPQPEGSVKPFAKQGGAPNDSIGKQRYKQRQEQIQAHKIGYFTAQLELTAAEAQAFWPVYNEYWEKRNKLFNERNNLLRKVKHEKVDDKKALQIAQRLVENTQDDAKLVREYHSKLEKILPPQKLLKYYAAEDSFRVELINILRKRQKTS